MVWIWQRIVVWGADGNLHPLFFICGLPHSQKLLLPLSKQRQAWMLLPPSYRLKIFDIWYEKNGRLKRVKWTFSSWFGLINLWFTRGLCCCACSVWIIPIYQALRNDFLVVRAICHSYPPISRAEGSESHLAVNISLRGFGCILRPVWHVQVKPLCWWGW